MTAQIRKVQRNAPMLLPPDLRDWVPDDDIVHFIIGAVEQAPIPLHHFHVNDRGTGHKQYSPKMMLALLIYCYANGTFSSRKIERATHINVAVRFLTADQHPDHDTICRFRRRNQKVFKQAFVHVLQLAGELGVLKIGTVSVDGTHIKANASKNRNVRYDRAKELEKKLRKDIDALLEKAEEADGDDSDDGQRLPDEIARREKLLEKIRQAQADLERRAEERHAAERERYEKKLDEYEERQKDKSTRGGQKPKEPENTGPRDEEQSNLTDDDSRLMRKNHRAEYTQSYNCQAVVDADGSQLILGQHVTNCASDAGQLTPALGGIAPEIGRAETALADNGYLSADELERLEKEYDIYIPVTSEDGNNRRRYDYRPPKEKKTKAIRDRRLLTMKEKMESDKAKELYRKRKQTVEPVFGIIKSVLGFREFLLRGLEKVSIEWTLVTLAYNLKRLYALNAAAPG